MELTNFLGGLWFPRYHGGAIPTNGLLQANNLRYLPTGGITGRGGRVRHNANFPFNRLHGLWRHYPRTGSPAFVAASDNLMNLIFFHDTVGAGTFTTISGAPTLATGTRPYWTNWPQKNTSFMANGASLWAYNGVFAQVIMTGTQITGPYISVHQSRLMGTVQAEINYSVYFSAVNDETKSDGQFSFNDQEGGSITGLCSLSDDLLVVLKSTNLWNVLGEVKFNPIKAKYSEVGSIAPNAIAQAPYGIFFVGRKGIYITDGRSPEPLYVSEPIETLFVNQDGSTINTYPTAVGVYYPRYDAYKVKLHPANLHSYLLQRLPASGRKVSWAWSLVSDDPLTAATVWSSEGDTGDLFQGDDAGNIWRVDTGVLDDGLPFQSTIQSPFFPFPEHRVGRIYRLFLDYYGNAPCAVNLRYDNAAVNAVSVSVGATQTAALQQARLRINDFSESGHLVSAVVLLPQMGPQTELYRLKLEERLRSARVWR